MDRIAALSALALFLVVFPGISPAAVSDKHSESVVDSVRNMLEAGISEDVILAWLDSNDDPIPHPSADHLIALQKAGASETLLKRLLIAPELPTEAATDSTVTPIPDTPKPQDSEREVMVNFTFSYSPWYLNDDEYDIANDSWDFFVYMDGIPLSYVPAAAVAGMTSNLEFSQLVPAGRHIIRATLEQHNRGTGKQWTHAAKVAEEAFVIDISPEGPQASISVRFKEHWGGIDRGGPVEFSFQQGNQVSELEGVGGNPDSWPPVCEEVEANSNLSKTPGSRLERDLRRCVSWGGLWNGTSAPPRSEVREALAMFEYRPVPKGS
jgi:hypothetical protein